MNRLYQFFAYTAVTLSLAGCSSSREQYNLGYERGAVHICLNMKNTITSLKAPLNPGNMPPSSVPEPTRDQFLKLRELEEKVNSFCDPFLQ